jgi:hypothetical protein
MPAILLRRGPLGWFGAVDVGRVGTVGTPSSSGTLESAWAVTDGSWRPSAVPYGAAERS